jgi:DNA-binding beta-propeller fold protein YncE
MRKHPPKKKKSRKPIGKGAKAVLLIFGLCVAAIGLYVIYDKVSRGIIRAKTVMVQLDLEVGSPGEGKNQFKEPWAVAADASGDFYVTDFSNHRVQKFDRDGVPLLTIGSRGKEPGLFEQPSGIFAGRNGNVFVCDTFNHRIQKLNSRGKVLKVWSHGFFGPRCIAGNNQGRLYVTDTGNHKVQVFDEDGNFQKEWGGNGTVEGKFREPVGCAVDDKGFVYVADSDNLRIQKFDPNGKFVSAFRVATWRGKNDEVPYLAFHEGFLYVTNTSEKCVLKYETTGKLKAIYSRKGGFQTVSGIAVDPRNRILVVEKSAGKVSRFPIPAK